MKLSCCFSSDEAVSSFFFPVEVVPFSGMANGRHIRIARIRLDRISTAIPTQILLVIRRATIAVILCGTPLKSIGTPLPLRGEAV
ncbi:hypothetical protein Taro_020043 [Colocasia esculenta]|uniref:Uncharacterized protein n=1 Tax=Colocasia esculenta TaxID=4460 RepID=A0A843UYH2_COLES|nr:hypothetical protein [Colocasia esculenta]